MEALKRQGYRCLGTNHRMMQMEANVLFEDLDTIS